MSKPGLVMVGPLMPRVVEGIGRMLREIVD